MTTIQKAGFLALALILATLALAIGFTKPAAAATCGPTPVPGTVTRTACIGHLDPATPKHHRRHHAQPPAPAWVPVMPRPATGKHKPKHLVIWVSTTRRPFSHGCRAHRCWMHR